MSLEDMSRISRGGFFGVEVGLGLEGVEVLGIRVGTGAEVGASVAEEENLSLFSSSPQ
jgi:hypothetical protein